MILLKHCRCIDCRNWIKAPYSECRYGIIRNGVKDTPDFPADAWHYCARYQGPQISRDVWVWPKVPPTAAQVGAGSKISDDPDGVSTTSARDRDRGEPGTDGFACTSRDSLVSSRPSCSTAHPVKPRCDEKRPHSHPPPPDVDDFRCLKDSTPRTPPTMAIMPPSNQQTDVTTGVPSDAVPRGDDVLSAFPMNPPATMTMPPDASKQAADCAQCLAWSWTAFPSAQQAQPRHSILHLPLLDLRWLRI